MIKVNLFISILQTMQNLEELSIADFHIEFPETLLSSLVQLKYLNLSKNELQTLSLDLLNPISNIEVLDLSHNDFNSISERLAERLFKIPNVILEDNPFICDICHANTLIERIKNVYVYIY